jgi:hypothetical protein
MTEIQALAADFEAAWKAEKDLPDDYTDAQMDTAVARTRIFVDRILALSGTDLSIQRLKARAYLWAEAAHLVEWFAEREDLTTADRALAGLFRDLGADYPVGAAPAA